MSSSKIYDVLPSEMEDAELMAEPNSTSGVHARKGYQHSSKLFGGCSNPPEQPTGRISRYWTSHQAFGRWYTIFVSLMALSATIGWAQTLHHLSRPGRDQQDTNPLKSQQKVSLGECGDTPEESLRRGCVFDLMMYNWVHPACYYRDLSQRFIDEGNWTFYADAEGRRPLRDHEAIHRGEVKQVWLRGDFHHSHCAYIFQKRLLAQDGGAVALDVKTRSRAHTEHCIEWVSRPKPRVFELATLNLTNESLDCVAGPLSLECQVGYDKCPRPT